MNEPSFPRLVADVGGTHARFALVLQPRGPVHAVASYRCADFAGLLQAAQHYLRQHALDAPRAFALGVATPVTGDTVRLTNHPWTFSIRELKAALGLQQLLVLNDFSALALSLPVLDPADLRQVGGGCAVPGAPVGLVGPGTGLGVSGLLPLPRGRGHVPIGGEGGHVTLAAGDADEAAAIQWLHGTYGHASAERALSGPGLESLYQAVCDLQGLPQQAVPAAEVSRLALLGQDQLCVKAMNLFCALLGGVAGNLALTLGARGGVYIGGGIVPQLGAFFDRSPFRARFEGKGRFRAYLRDIPTWVVNSEVSPALLGASRALDGWLEDPAPAP